MKNGTEKEVVGFDFQIIPMAEAQSLALAGTGNYSELKAVLLEKLPTLPENECFAFGLPKGEVSEFNRRTICTVLTKTLKKAQLPYRVTYSRIRKLFLCVPKEAPISRGSYKKSKLESPAYPMAKPEPGKRGSYKKHSKEEIKAAIKLFESGIPRAELLKKTGIPLTTLKNYLYTKTYRRGL